MDVANLHWPGDHLLVPTPISGNWANGGSISLGRDCLAVTEQLLDMMPDTVTFRSSFRPPPEPGLSMAHAWMRAPVAGSTPNNFEQVIDQGEAGTTVMWGHEKFTIITTVDRKSGVILRAQMEDNLDPVADRLYGRRDPLRADHAIHHCAARDAPDVPGADRRKQGHERSRTNRDCCRCPIVPVRWNVCH